MTNESEDKLMAMLFGKEAQQNIEPVVEQEEPVKVAENTLFNCVHFSPEKRTRKVKPTILPPTAEDFEEYARALWDGKRGHDLPVVIMLPYDPAKCKGCEGEMNRQNSVSLGDTGECFICNVSCPRKKAGETSGI